MSTYEKVKREIVLWVGLIAAILVGLGDVAGLPGWIPAVGTAALAGLVRFRVTPSSDPRDLDGTPLVPDNNTTERLRRLGN